MSSSVSRRFGGYVKVKRKPRPLPRQQDTTPRPSRDDDPLVGERASSINTSLLAPPSAPPPRSLWQRSQMPLLGVVTVVMATAIFVLAARSQGGYTDASAVSASARSGSPAYVSTSRREGGGEVSGSGGGANYAQAFLAANMAKRGGMVEVGASSASHRSPDRPGSGAKGDASPHYREFPNTRCQITAETAAGAAESMTRCLSMGKTTDEK